MAQPTEITSEQQPQIEVEVEDEGDFDSGISDTNSNASTSITSSVCRYEFKHGRRYHSYQAGQYSFPNDSDEQDRLDMIHHVFYRLIGDRLFLAPIDPAGLNILDIGTGTGLWAIRMGDEHPGANILGNDLSPIQPDWVPPNVKFIVDDVEMDWAEPLKYGYIHVCYMAGSIKDWPRLVRQIYENLAPGGWVEFQESINTLYSEDDSLKPDNPMVEMMNHLHEASGKLGRTMDPAPMFRTWAEEVGFTNVKEERFKLPIGGWPKDPKLKEIGTLMGINFHEGVSAFTAVLFKEVLGWKSEDVELFNASVRKAVRQKDVHPIFDVVVLMAQKKE